MPRGRTPGHETKHDRRRRSGELGGRVVLGGTLGRRRRRTRAKGFEAGSSRGGSRFLAVREARGGERR